MKKTVLLNEEGIVRKIYLIRGKKVMLDRGLAEMYGVLTKNLNKAVKRNLRRFPDDFMFQLTAEEAQNLWFQIGTSSSGQKKSWGGARTLPYVFTEQGVAMLSSILNSDTAIDVNIQVIRVFTRIREILLSQKDVVSKIEKLEKHLLEQNSKVGQHEEENRKIFLVLKRLIKTDSGPMKKVGYKRKNEA